MKEGGRNCSRGVRGEGEERRKKNMYELRNERGQSIKQLRFSRDNDARGAQRERSLMMKQTLGVSIPVTKSR